MTRATVTASLTVGSVVVNDAATANGSTKTVVSVERNMNNLGAALVRYDDGSWWHCGWFTDYHHVVTAGEVTDAEHDARVAQAASLRRLAGLA